MTALPIRYPPRNHAAWRALIERQSIHALESPAPARRLFDATRPDFTPCYAQLRHLPEFAPG